MYDEPFRKVITSLYMLKDGEHAVAKTALPSLPTVVSVIVIQVFHFNVVRSCEYRLAEDLDTCR
jgi:hypothetical protein